MRPARVILKNILSLSAAEMANKGILFIATAYLARAILPEGNGIINFANNLASWFLIAVSLGFDMVGSRDIAKNPGETQKYANQITTLRIFLAIISFVIINLIAIFLDKPVIIKYVIFNNLFRYY